MRIVKSIGINTKPAGEPQDKPVFDLPVFPDEDIEVDAILDHLSRRFEKKLANEDAKTWFDVNVRIDGPVGLAVVGDPHLGTHCNIPSAAARHRDHVAD